MLSKNFSVTMRDIKNNKYYDGNDHVHKFYEIRKDLVPPPSSDIKLITGQYYPNGNADFLFSCTATPYPDEEFHPYEELAEAPYTDIPNAGELVDNPSADYMMCIRVCDFSQQCRDLDYDILADDYPNANIISKALNNSQRIKYACSCPSFMWTGISYYCTLEDASLMPCTIEPTKWKELREGALCCKHLSGLFRTISFFIPQCAMSLSKYIRQHREELLAD